MTTSEETRNEAGGLSFTVVELKESASLGADVRLEIEPRTTVLVGKNGAGKSLLLERIYAAVHGAWGVVQTPEPDPAHFACEVDVSSQCDPRISMKIRYECHWRPRDEQESSGMVALRITPDVDLKIDEHCWILDDKNSLLWRVDDGVVTYNDDSRGEISTGRTLINWTISRPRRVGGFLFPNMTYPLRDLFSGVVRMPAGLPRSNNQREELAMPYPQSHRKRDSVEPRRVAWIAYRLADWHEKAPHLFEEFAELGRRTGLLNGVKVKMYRDPDANNAPRRDLVSIIIDGTDIGLLSDGTLRVAEILVWLIFPEVKLLLIEEPETAIHPGLLSKLLAEIEAYSNDRQIILSTQSPQVVSWAAPRAIRLVERHAGHSEVRGLREDEISRVSAYLRDEGNLGDFVYSGALDG